MVTWPSNHMGYALCGRGLNFDFARYHQLLAVIDSLSSEQVINAVRARKFSSVTGFVAAALPVPSPPWEVGREMGT